MSKNFSRNIFNPAELQYDQNEFKLEFVSKQKKNQAEQKIFTHQKSELELLIEQKEVLENEIKKIKREAEEAKHKIVKEQEENELVLSQQMLEHKNEIEKEKKEILEKSKTEANEIIEKAKVKEKEILERVQAEEDKTINEQKEIGYHEGYKTGYDEGKEERERVEIYLKKILNETISKRDEILDRFQQHLTDIVLLIVRKIVKKITEKDENVVIENINACLLKIQGPVSLTIRINISDMKQVKSFKKKIMTTFSTLKQVDLIEDPTIEVGGCVVETDFAMVDGRISSQLDKIEKIITSTNLV